MHVSVEITLKQLVDHHGTTKLWELNVNLCSAWERICIQSKNSNLLQI